MYTSAYFWGCEDVLPKFIIIAKTFLASPNFIEALCRNLSEAVPVYTNLIEAALICLP